ncbi:MAG: flagellin [Sphingobium sp.]
MVGITNKTMIAEIRRQQKLSQEIVDGQTSISSGKTLNRASDDALAWVQLSDVGKGQAQQAAWQSNVATGTARGATAEAALSDINNMLTRAQELMTLARNGVGSDTSLEAIAEEMKTIRASVDGLIGQKDYQGVSVFDEGRSVLVPVGRGLNIDVVATREQVSSGIDVNGTPMTLDAIFAQSIAALASGDDDALAASVTAVTAGQEHIAIEQTRQGVRSRRLEDIGTRLTDVDLDLNDRRTDLESSDLTQVIASVKAKLIQLEAAQAAFARINQQTLFDLIR